jgi:beta-glucosidase
MKLQKQADCFLKQIVEEGTVMLKNNNAMPFPAGAKISVFGKNSVDLAYGASGSGGKNHVDNVTIFESLEAAGFEYNPILKAFYEDDNLSGDGRSSNPSIENAGVSTLLTGETRQSLSIQMKSSKVMTTTKMQH